MIINYKMLRIFINDRKNVKKNISNGSSSLFPWQFAHATYAIRSSFSCCLSWYKSEWLIRVGQIQSMYRKFCDWGSNFAKICSLNRKISATWIESGPLLLNTLRYPQLPCTVSSAAKPGIHSDCDGREMIRS